MPISEAIREWLRGWLGINESISEIAENVRGIEEDVRGVKERLRSIEERINSIEEQLVNYGNYAKQSQEVLEFMLTNIKNWIGKLEYTVSRMKQLEDRVEQLYIDKANKLLRRLRNNRTRIENNLRRAG